MVVGRTLLHYQVLRKLGEGGMAAVYLAEDPHGAKVVLKVPFQEYAHDREFVRRLTAEKDALCRINHPCIASFRNFHEDIEPPFLVIEFVDGPPLSKLLGDRPGPWPIAATSRILLQIAEALAYCHKAGIIHRDVKPANVLITGSDHVKVTDFGIAKLKDAPSLTQTGVIVGSALIMAPEQWRGGELTPKVDIYALGVVAYRMFTGRYPFEGSVEELRVAHVEDFPVPARSVNPDLPPPLSNLIMECLNKDPQRRLSSCDEFIRRLTALGPSLEFYERYRIEDEIGRGAMGVVYRSTRRDDGMTVAIKTLDQRLTDPSLMRRLKAEASVLARLNHAFICPLIEARAQFLVMQYVSGETLSDCIRKHDGLSASEALRYFGDILQAVAAAHRENVIHRDLKPSNIMVTDDPIEKHAIVMDFGIAKLLGSSGVTRTSEAVGAIPYKAPELWQRSAPDQRSDIYALGVMLYEMLTNSLPFDGPEVSDFERQHQYQDPPQLPESVGGPRAALDGIIRRCLAKAPEDRYESVDRLYREVADAARAPVEEQTQYYVQPVSAPQETAVPPAPVASSVPPTPSSSAPPPVVPPPVRSRSRWLPWAALGAVVIAAVAYLTLGGDEAAPPLPASSLPLALHLPGGTEYIQPRDESLSFGIDVSVPAADASVRVWAVPDSGVQITRAARDRYTLRFDAYASCPERHRLVIYAEGTPSGQRDSQAVAIALTDALPPPELTLDATSFVVADAPVSFPFRVAAGPRDSIRRVWADPGDGVRIRDTGDGAYEMTFTPFAGCPNPHYVTVNVEGRGGIAGRDVVFTYEMPTDFEIQLRIAPAAHVLIDGRSVTSDPIVELRRTQPSRPREITIMHPSYPLYTIRADQTGSSLNRSVDLAAGFRDLEPVELRMNVVGLDIPDGSPSPIRINGDPVCELKERCNLLPGAYLFDADLGTGHAVDSIRFNGVASRFADRVLALKTPAEGVRFNRLVFYVH